MNKIIKDWVKENYGDSEADNPSWDIKKLAEHIEKKTGMDDDTYNYIYDSMCLVLDLLDDLSNPDYDRQYKKLDKAIEKFYNWYNKKD